MAEEETRKKEVREEKESTSFSFRFVLNSLSTFSSLLPIDIDEKNDRLTFARVDDRV